MSEWKEITWGEIVTLEYGKGLTDYQNSSGKFPVFGTNGRIGFTDTYLCPYPGVIVGRKGAYRGVHYSNQPFFVIDTAFYLKPISENTIDLRYAYYKLLTQDINRLDSGSAIPSTSRDDFYRLELELPPFEEQKEIAAILTSFDDKISILHRQNQTLEQIAQTLFKRWFVEFEFPNEHGQPYKSSGGKMAASELGEIPEGWRVGRFFDGFELLGGGTPKTSETDYWDGKIKWLSAKDITPNHKKFILKTEKTITGIGLKNSAAKLLPKFTTVISARGTVGNYCILAEEMCISQSNYGIGSKNKNRSFFTFLFIANVIDRLKAQAYGSVFDTITSYTFRDLEIIQPDEKIIDEFENMICSFFQKMLNNEKEIQNLTIIRETLLPKLMSGQIRVAG